MRLVAGKFAVLAVTTLFAATAIVSCSTKSDQAPTERAPEDTKNVSLQLEIAPQANVDSVHYVVRNSTDGVVKEGDLPVPGGEETFVFGISLPVGGPYTITLTAGNATISCNGTTGPFSISATSQASASATLVCRDISTGDVVVDVDTISEACPALTMNYIVATPSSAPADAAGNPASSQIQVLSSSTDANGTTPAYVWSVSPANAGTFVNANAQNTAFNCDLAGQAILTITSTITTPDGTCDDTLTIPVDCANVTCGNNLPDPGETCDGQPGCPADCTVLCGDNVVEYTEECEPANTGVCNATCNFRAPVCGDGFFTPPRGAVPGEACDPSAPAGGGNDPTTCSPTCQIVAANFCGDSTVGGTEECESPAPVAQGTFPGDAGCSNDCQSVASAACLTCEASSPCVDLQLGCANLPTAAGRTACHDLAECIRDNPTCAATAPEPCYCGALDTASCAARPSFPDPNAPAGPCARQFEAAMETAVPATVLVNFSNLAVPGAHAIQRVLCDEAFCPVCFQ